MTVRVRIGGHLRSFASAPTEVEIEGAKDVADLVRRLDARFPGFKDRVFDEREVTRIYINIFLNEENVRDLAGERTKLGSGDVIYILPSVAGGRQ